VGHLAIGRSNAMAGRALAEIAFASGGIAGGLGIRGQWQGAECG